MIELQLSRDYGGTAQLRLPTDVSVYREALEHQRENVGILKVTHVGSSVENLGHYLTYTPILDFSDLSKLNALAEKVDTMSPREQRLFAGALDAESVNGLADILRIAGSLEQYEIIEGVTSNRELGGWLVENGRLDVSFPEAVRPYLDYAAIGAGYYADHGGSYTANGYIKRREDAPVQAEVPRTMLLTLTASERSYPLVLPASKKQLDQAKNTLGIDDFSQASVSNVEYAAPYLTRLVPMDCVTVEDANTLANRLQKMKQKEDGLMKFCAVLEVEQPATFYEAIDIARDLDNYEIVPDDTEEYGKQALRRIGADDEIIDTIDGYMDFAQLGEVYMEEDGVRQTGYGLVRRLSKPFPEQEIGQTMM